MALRWRIGAIIGIILVLVLLFTGIIQSTITVVFPPFILVIAGIPFDVRNIIVVACFIGVVYIANKVLCGLGKYSISGSR